MEETLDAPGPSSSTSIESVVIVDDMPVNEESAVDLAPRFTDVMVRMQATMNAVNHAGLDETEDKEAAMAELEQSLVHLDLCAERMGVKGKAVMFGKRLKQKPSNRLATQIAFKSKKSKKRKMDA